MTLPAILWQNICEGAALTASSSAADFPVQNLGDWEEYTHWQAAASGSVTVTVDAGAAVTVDSLAIVGHNLAGQTVKLESSATGAWAGEHRTLVPTSTPATDDPLVRYFLPVSARYFRLSITAASAARVGVLYIGRRLEFPRGLARGYDPRPVSVEADATTSKQGHLLGVVTRYRRIRLRAVFEHLPAAWVYGPLREFGTSHGFRLRPFVWVPWLGTLPSHLVRLVEGCPLSGPLETGGDRLQGALPVEMEGIDP